MHIQFVFSAENDKSYTRLCTTGSGGGVAINAEFKLALSPHRHKSGARMPCSNKWNRDIPSNAWQSEMDPGYKIDIIQKSAPDIAHGLTVHAKLLLSAAVKFPGLHPTLKQSFAEGLCVKIRIPSIAPEQHLNPADDTSEYPAAIARCLSWSSRYKIVNFGCLFTASTTYYRKSLWLRPRICA
jgi:hypothetical protein